MPEVAAVAVAEAFAAIGAESIAIAIYTAPAWTLTAIAAAASVYTLRDQQRKATNSARDAYNNSLQDRYVMQRGAATPRQVVLGRQRVSGPIAFVQSFGANRESLTFLVLLAAHEIDAVEAIYINDEIAVLDAGGGVLGVNRREQFAMTGASGTFTIASDAQPNTVSAWVDYGSTRVTLSVSGTTRAVSVSGGTAGQTGTVTIQYQPSPSPWVNNATGTDLQTSFALSGSTTAGGSTTLVSAPVAGSVSAVWSTGSGQDRQDLDLSPYTSVSGSTVTVAGAPLYTASSGNVAVTYRISTATTSRMRITSYLGASGQAADAAMISAFPGVWTSAHALTGQAYLKVECTYDPDAFPSGLPNISAVIRGAKVFDPRTGTTAWSQNPALLVRYAATSALLGRMPASMVNDTNIAAQALHRWHRRQERHPGQAGH